MSVNMTEARAKMKRKGDINGYRAAFGAEAQRLKDWHSPEEVSAFCARMEQLARSLRRECGLAPAPAPEVLPVMGDEPEQPKPKRKRAPRKPKAKK